MHMHSIGSAADSVKAESSLDNGHEAPRVETSQMKFRLLKRDFKGRIETKEMLIPEQSMIAKASKKDEILEKEEHARMKQYVLRYEERERYNKASNAMEPIPEIRNSTLKWTKQQISRKDEADETSQFVDP